MQHLLASSLYFIVSVPMIVRREGIESRDVFTTAVVCNAVRCTMVRRDRGECGAVQFDILSLVLIDLFHETGCKEQEEDDRLHCYVRTRIARTVQ